MDYHQLQAFLAVVDSGGFTSAAAELGVPQPTLSRRIGRLEAELGRTLLIRREHPVALTPAGAAVVDHLRTAADSMRHATYRLEHEGSGTRALRVGYVQSAAYGWTLRLLTAARAARTPITLRAMSSEDQLLAMRDGQLDAGLLRPASTNHTLRGIAVRTLDRHRLVAVLPLGHPLSTKRLVSRRDLLNEPLVLYPRSAGPGLRHIIDVWLIGAGVDPHEIQEAWDAPTAMSLVAAGAGIALLIEPLRPTEANVTLVAMRGGPRFDLCLATPDARALSTLTPALDRHLQQ